MKLYQDKYYLHSKKGMWKSLKVQNPLKTPLNEKPYKSSKETRPNIGLFLQTSIYNFSTTYTYKMASVDPSTSF